MPVTTDTMRPMGRLNVIFAISSGLFLVTMIWFVAVDHNVAWREHQDDYMVAKAVLAHFDYLYTQRASEQEKLKEAAERLRVAQSGVDSRQNQIAELEGEMSKLKAVHDDVKLEHGAANSVFQVTLQTYEKVLAKYGPEAPETKAVLQQKEREADRLAKLAVAKEENEDRRHTIDRRLKALRKPLVEAQKAYDALLRRAQDAQKHEQEFGSKFRRTVFNAPMFDFAVPKNTPGAQEVKQLVLPDVRQRLNYLESYTTDRCVTCHIAIDNPEFTQETLAAKLEEAIPSINEAQARHGRAPLAFPSVPELTGDEAPKLKEGRVAEHWDALPPELRKAYFGALLETVNGYLADEGISPLELSPVLMAHPELDLYVNINSAHPMKTMGCTVCHEGNPQETDFVLAAHTPKSHAQEHEWEEKYYTRNLGIPAATFELVEHYWDRPMLPIKYTEGSCVKCHQQPSGIPSFNGEQQARRIRKGHDLFVRTGCINCHLVSGLGDSPQVGPSLTHIESKLDPGWVQKWVFDPRSFRPSTWMPHFFMQENNGPGSDNDYDPDPVLRTETEVQAITYYLYNVSLPWVDMEQPPAGMEGDADHGRELFNSVGCLACHGNLAEFGRDWIIKDRRERGETPEQAKANFDAMDYVERVKYAMTHFPDDRDTVFAPEEVKFDPAKPYNKPVFTRVAPELSLIGSKVSVEWLYAWLRNPSAYHEETRMPRLRLSEQEAMDLATYLKSMKLDPGKDRFNPEPFPDDAKHVEEVDRLVYDILASQRSDARTRQVMADQDGELTRMLLDLLKNSESYEAVRSRLGGMDPAQKRLFFLGSKTISHYGCYACHNIPGMETAVRPGTELTVWSEKPLSQLDFGFFDPAFDEVRELPENKALFSHLYPPDRGDLVDHHRGVNPEEEITHGHAAFATHKLLNPRIYDRQKQKKPRDKLKMGNFYLAPDQVEALVTFLMGRKPPRVTDKIIVDFGHDAKSRIPGGRDLTQRFNCVGCHKIDGNVPTIQQYFRVSEGGMTRFDEVNAPPGLRGEGAKVQADWLYGFLNNVVMLRPWLEVRMPSFHLTGDQSTVLVEHFAGLAQQESGVLDRRLARVDEYVAGARLASDASATNGHELPPGADWFEQASVKDEARFLGNYSVEHRLMRAYELDPEENSKDDLAAAFEKVHDETSFLRDLYSAAYPFADVPVVEVSDERFKLGESLMLELGCLKCHVFGDPTIKGANPNPSAPNLNLAHSRLRQDWIRYWAKAPAVIQPGTKMPQLWPDMKSAFADFGEDRAALEAKYGATADEQISLLIDYLYTAGTRNHTAIDPNVAAVETAPEGGEEIFDEDSMGEEEFDEDAFDG